MSLHSSLSSTCLPLPDGCSCTKSSSCPIISHVHEISLGLLRALPFEAIKISFSWLSASDLVKLGRTNKAYHRISQIPKLWKNLTNISFSIRLIPPSDTNWKAIYKQHAKYERNFVLMRQRTFSLISSIRPSSRKQIPRARALTMTTEKHYICVDIEGNLKAISRNRGLQTIYNVHGQIQTLPKKAWNIQTLIHNQFVQLAVLDGAHSFTPKVNLEAISHLNPEQKAALDYLNFRIKEWFTKTMHSSNLDEEVKNALRDHHNGVTQISCKRAKPHSVQPEHKAYLIFFRAIVENPVLQESWQ